jgi:predicted nucleic acid-binding protein
VSRFAAIKDEIQRLNWSDEVSEAFSAIKAGLERRGERIEDFDAAVAAHALVEEAVLVTANRKHLARVQGLEISTKPLTRKLHTARMRRRV